MAYAILSKPIARNLLQRNFFFVSWNNKNLSCDKGQFAKISHESKLGRLENPSYHNLNPLN